MKEFAFVELGLRPDDFWSMSTFDFKDMHSGWQIKHGISSEPPTNQDIDHFQEMIRQKIRERKRKKRLEGSKAQE